MNKTLTVENSSKKRIKWIDITKGIAILLVITGHTIPRNTLLWNFIFSFHMPIFFVVSGYLFRESNIKKLSIKNFQRMIIPYLGTSFIILFIGIFSKFILHHSFKSMPPNIFSLIPAIIYGCGVNSPKFFTPVWMIGAIWFLLCLFFAELFFAILLNITKQINTYIQSIIIICLSVIGYFIGQHIFLPWNIDIALVAIIFLYTGYIFKKQNIINKNINIAIIIVAIIFWVLSIKLGAMDMAGRKYSNFIICILGAISASYIIIKLCELISKYDILTKSLSFLGKETLVIFCFHLLEMDFMPWHSITKLLGHADSKILTIAFKIIFAIIVVFTIKKIPLVKNIYYFPNSPKFSKDNKVAL